jgi:hypothetical protein
MQGNKYEIGNVLRPLGGDRYLLAGVRRCGGNNSEGDGELLDSSVLGCFGIPVGVVDGFSLLMENCKLESNR